MHKQICTKPTETYEITCGAKTTVKSFSVQLAQ